MTKYYRDNGAIGALLDEYENVIEVIIRVISDITNEDLMTIVDHRTDDVDCKSVQTILTHVVRAGYNYVVEIRKSFGEKIDFFEFEPISTVEQYTVALIEMFKYSEQLFLDYPDTPIEEYNSEKKILVKWGQRYDVEQLFEHAIVHILRHRRQIEKFKIKLNAK